jgi:signal transduction histidine kinase
VALVKSLLKKNLISAHLDLGAKRSTFLHPQQMAQVLMNLINNAVKPSPACLDMSSAPIGLREAGAASPSDLQPRGEFVIG